MFEYSGSMHMHSHYSDGSGSVEDIVKAAVESDLDFIILTDHNTLKAKDKGYEKWYKNTMLIVGYEVNDRKNRNHYIALGTDKITGTYEKLPDGDTGSRMSACEYVKAVNEEGGFGFIAHPHEERNNMPQHPPYPWTAWDCEDFTGIEIWNHMSEWAEGLNESNKFQRFLHPLKSIIAPPEKTLKVWDDLNLKRKVVAIGGVDAHAHKHNVMGMEFEIFPYKVLFKSIRTHVFLNDELKMGNSSNYTESRDKILEAIAKGRSFIVNNYYGNGKGFRFYAEYDGVHYNTGDEIKFVKKINKKIIFRTLIPSTAKIKVIHNGKCINESEGMEFTFDTDKTGAYRIETWKENKGWIFSNHIRVVSE
ncbi:MAG TPA: CehA/McbA family metallohydrolase [Ignavibacteria bacterium]|nr:histidinol-phosphatase [Bacteroidota bacterium]HRI83827.1 CehA/McbA family metallohydrolase [Ignavibacteria bacterium]HRJ99958.1 CehA/McbA family metallohydrolase [Ignavibacteria bacterium]